MILFYGIASSACFATEAILIRYIAARGVYGGAGGYLTLFFDGVYGLIMLTYLTATGVGIQTLPGANIWTLFSAGVRTSLALVLVNYSVANGIAGISFSVANSFPVWHAIFNMVFLG